MLEAEYQTVRQLSFTMVIQLSELERLMERLQQLQLQELYLEILLLLKQLLIMAEQWLLFEAILLLQPLNQIHNHLHWMLHQQNKM